MTDVFDDRGDLAIAERTALNFRPDGIETDWGCRRRHRYEATGRFAEAAERWVGEADLVGADQAVIGEQKRREQDFRPDTQLDAAEAAEHLGAQRLRTSRDHHHVFAAGIEIDAPDF